MKFSKICTDESGDSYFERRGEAIFVIGQDKGSAIWRLTIGARDFETKKDAVKIANKIRKLLEKNGYGEKKKV